MICYAYLRRLVCRKLLTVLLFSYIGVILLFLLRVDVTEPKPESDLSLFPLASSPGLSPRADVSQREANRTSVTRLAFSETPGQTRQIHSSVSPPTTQLPEKYFQSPSPISEPDSDLKISDVDSGDFVAIAKQVYVYSAFMDDRKEKRFIRILTLTSQNFAVTYNIYCYFNDSISAPPVKAVFYQLCENHARMFGGYFYSCPVPDSLETNSEGLNYIVISASKHGPRIKLNVLQIQPPKYKIPFLDAYPQEKDSPLSSQILNVNLNVPSDKQTPPTTTGPSNTEFQPSFAICVSPLFGNVNPYRLIEFIELSRLLGAEHFYFYNHSLPEPVSRVLRFYSNRKIATVLPWRLPSIVPGAGIWYNGQLLANNDCLYRAMPKHDLVSFNDIDEFVVPHSNFTTWGDAFRGLLTHDRCGLSFQSAFYDLGLRSLDEDNLLTPILIARSKEYSKVRTKVILCPWRVFEVGIHHISKQNRELWRSHSVDPAYAYVHHYRQCAADYGMNCKHWDKDTTVGERYLRSLTTNFVSAVKQIFSLLDRPQWIQRLDQRGL
ncbi:beta-1,4-galactosyltransferase galt-1-like [Physella acuta]|uniref:beta-1,4-galactosyltransferase galt-1-like n=1 Tax=Physella acuta TaxID=109671 RepID=UPI0027DC2B3F|nr:beta-1,4-galactosyltransferase galt-1-like [Physella acuta]